MHISVLHDAENHLKKAEFNWWHLMFALTWIADTYKRKAWNLEQRFQEKQPAKVLIFAQNV